MTGRVLFPVAPMADESLDGLLWRVASENRYDTAQWIRAHSGIRGSGCEWDAPRIARLAGFLDLPAADLAARAYLATPSGRLFPGATVGHKHVEVWGSKTCIACLREGGYHSAVFDLLAIQACPRHASRLVSCCGTCGSACTWSRQTPHHCIACGTDDHRSEPEAVDPAELVGTAALARKAGFGQMHPAIAEADIAMPDTFAAFPLGDLITLMRRLGAYASGEPGQRSWQMALFDDKERTPAIINAAWDILRDWPGRFHAFLTGIEAESTGPGARRAGLRNPFGRFYGYIADRGDEPWRTVRATFEQHIRETALVLPRKGAVVDAGVSDGSSRYVSRVELARTLGVARTDALIRTGAIATVSVPRLNGGGQKGMEFFERSEVEHLFPQAEPPLDLRGTADRLGLSLTLTKRLISEGHLPTVDGPSVSGIMRYLVSAPDVAAFVNDLVRPLEIAAHSRSTVDIAKIMKGQKTLDVPLSRILEAVWSGELKVMAHDDKAAGVGSLRFDRREAKALLDRLAMADREAGDVTLAWIMKSLSVNKLTVKWLEVSGFLARLSGKGNLRPFTKASFECFHAEWAKAGELAEAYGTSRMLISRALRSAGVATTPLPETGDITLFFKRQEVAALDVRALLDEVAVHRGKTWHDYDAGLKMRNGRVSA